MFINLDTDETTPGAARSLKLPTYQTLQYVQALAVSSVIVLLAVYLGARVVTQGPGALARAARRRTGV